MLRTDCNQEWGIVGLAVDVKKQDFPTDQIEFMNTEFLLSKWILNEIDQVTDIELNLILLMKRD